MKKLALSFLFTFMLLQTNAQIKSREIDAEDIKTMLEFNGYEMYSYDLTSLQNKDYEVSVYVESSDSTDRQSFTVNMGPNRRLVSSMSKEGQSDYLRRKPKDKKYFAKIEQLSIYLLPLNDSTKTLVFTVPNAKRYSCRIKLKGQTNGRKTAYLYNCVPINLSRLDFNKKNPLLFYGSYWWDSNANLFRFCGVPDISTQLSSCDLTQIPHSYMIGIEVKEASPAK